MNSDIIRGVYAAFATGDVPGVVGAFDAGIRWTEAEGFPYGGIYIGPDAVVALGDYGGTCKATGKSFTAPFAHVWALRAGKVVRFQQYTDTALVQAAMR